LSEVAYQLADTNSGNRTVIAKDIVKLNADVATAFGVFLSGVIRVSTPSASHSNKSCWYTGYIHQIDLTITACGSSTQGNTSAII
jgi:hypothetical protein